MLDDYSYTDPEMSFDLYAIDHDDLEIWILRVLRAIGERNRAEWTAVVRELRRYKLTDPLEEEPLTGRSIARWDDPRLMASLFALTRLQARSTFEAGTRMYGWVLDLPLRVPPSPQERLEFDAFRNSILNIERPIPKHLVFLADIDAQCSYVLPDEVIALAKIMTEQGYFKRAAQVCAYDLEEPSCGQFLARLAAFVETSAKDGHALYFRELYT